MRNSFSHTFSLFIRNTLLTKKAGAVLLIFLAAYTLGTGIGFFLDHTPFHKNAEAVETSAEGNWGLSFQEEGQPPVANATFEELAQYDAFYAQDTNEKILYLTFDCGYENGNTPQILDALKKHGAPATFFVVGTYIESNPELIKRMISEGHTVGNHTWHHPDMAQISAMEIFQKELTDVEDAYKEVTGEEMTKFYRPPQGKYSESNLKNAQQLGYQTFFWSLAYVDWYENDQPTKEEAFDKLIGRIHPGAIVLLHNTSRTNAEILDELLGKWEEMGYQIRALAELSAQASAK
ncbi:MAG TPA: polysaccharide deacetylase family protein [Candidatus Mediterraneibacter pullicola]|uniref:Polysaccharide deacetylase family protein n=1 Tax=Candidatus Mediterraneibacter pullicola TaxID=2838682 RepID=A0A9D2H8X8_9FIRM|nr:polysaccharide deacetylase family protein [Candidatus Mediterraneibacter pullicola]